MIDLDKEIIGFPFRKQFLGGVNKTDVTEYMENLMALIENDRVAMEKERIELYELMKNGQSFCSRLEAESQAVADALIADAQQKADGLLQAANEKLQSLHDEHKELLLHTSAVAEKLVTVITQQQQEIAISYELLLQPVKDLLNILEGEKDAF